MDTRKSNKEEQEAFNRFSSEIRNKTLAEIYISLKDILTISQKEYCKRIGVSESRFSRVLSKIEKTQ